LVSSKSVDPKGFSLSATGHRGSVVGSSCQAIILGVYTGSAPKLEQAINDALVDTDANVVANATVNWQVVFPIVFGWECWSIKGDAYAVD
jgi:hypothetical protein